jgi:hypothetical protein
MSKTIEVKESEYRRLENTWRKLLVGLKGQIGDEYRASEDDTLPGMQVTFGVSVSEDGELSWSYQTGDNSFSGGAYCHSNWAVISLYRKSNSRELAHDAIEQIADLIAQQ